MSLSRRSAMIGLGRAAALTAAQEAVAIAESVGDQWRTAMWRITLAQLTRLSGDSKQALAIIDAVERFARPGGRDRLLQQQLVMRLLDTVHTVLQGIARYHRPPG